MKTILSTLQFAHEWRKSLGLFEGTEALRVFYGPGETTGHPRWLKDVAIDTFGGHYWLTLWKSVPHDELMELATILTEHFQAQSVVFMDRATVASTESVQTLMGTPPSGRFTVHENGIPYLIQFEDTKHPGLFLDHAPLREWLKRTQKGKSVLNLFAYTGSLSVAAGVGGAKSVTTLDLSQSTIEWAKENWKNAGLPVDDQNFIYGDVFDWVPRLIKKGHQYDTILSDPPSFSRTKTSGTFSTQKDLRRLHETILPALKFGGTLVTTINSENVSSDRFLNEIHRAAQDLALELQTIATTDLPASFPTSASEPSQRYLKGFSLVRTK